MASGGETQTGKEDYQAGIRAVELQPDFNTIQVCLVENMEGILIFTKRLNIQYFYDKTDTRVVHRQP